MTAVSSYPIRTASIDEMLLVVDTLFIEWNKAVFLQPPLLTEASGRLAPPYISATFTIRGLPGGSHRDADLLAQRLESSGWVFVSHMRTPIGHTVSAALFAPPCYEGTNPLGQQLMLESITPILSRAGVPYYFRAGRPYIP